MPEHTTSQAPLDKMITLRVDTATRAEWQSQAHAAGLSLGDWLRVQVSGGSGVRPVIPRRKSPPAADPALLAAIARIGNNLNQLARAANRQQWPGELELLRRLIDIERALTKLAPSHDD